MSRKLTTETWWSTQLPQWRKPDTVDCLWQSAHRERRTAVAVRDNLHQHQYLGMRGMSNSRRHSCKRSAFYIQFRNYWNQVVLVSAEIKVTFFQVAGTVLCFWFSRTMLINTLMLQLLHHRYFYIKECSVSCALPLSRYTRQEGAQPGRLTWTGQGVFPHRGTLCSIHNLRELGGRNPSLLRDRLGTSQSMMSNCMMSYLCFLVLFLSFCYFYLFFNY